MSRPRAGGRRGRSSARAVRSRSGRIRSWPNQSASAGLCTSTGDRVVGRSTPGAVTRADERVHQRGLAGAGRAADHGEQRRVDLHQPGQDVVLELVDHLDAGDSALVDARELQRQRGPLQGVTEAHKCGQHAPRRRAWGSTRPNVAHCPPPAGKPTVAACYQPCWATRRPGGAPSSRRRSTARAARSRGGAVPRRKRLCRKPSSIACCWYSAIVERASRPPTASA